MSNELIENAINRLWATIIADCKYDIRNRTMTFHLICYENGASRSLLLHFEEVTTIFHNRWGEDRKNYFNDDEPDAEPSQKLEIFSLHYFSDNPKKAFATELDGKIPDWMQNDYGVPNILMEIESSSLYIEAGYMTIDGVRYKLEREASI